MGNTAPNQAHQEYKENSREQVPDVDPDRARQQRQAVP